MTNDLIFWIEERLNADPDIDVDIGILVLAALEGDADLDDYLQGRAASYPSSARSTEEEPTSPATGAFLRSVQVTGFRGIGAPATLTLEPAPGLTVVAGRNGCGKSSLAEGLELVLTGGTYRWKNKKSAQWSEQWRNLHHGGPTEIAAEIIEEGSGPIRLRTVWEPTANLVDEHTTTAQRTVNGTKGPVQDAAVLGWAPALETYRPMLSYDELGRLLESGPSELYDAIAKVLGTEQLAHALARIKSRLTQLAAPQKAATADRKALQTEAAAHDDERAETVASLLRKTSPDTTAIRGIATGVSLPDQGIVASLRVLAHLESPDAIAIDAAAARLRAAVGAMADAGEAEAARQVARLDLRRQALRLHTDHGNQSCPVCSTGELNEAWAAASRDLIARQDAELRRLSDARAELEAARRTLRGLVQRRPPSTDRAPSEELDPIVARLRQAWQAFESVPEGDLALADHLEQHCADLAAATAAVRTSATAALNERDDAWGPLAARISAWCQAWDDAAALKPTIERLAAAEKWLKDNDTRLKNERIEPISEAAKHAWSLLRQESNVDLGALRLEGQATRRRVTITATVDGTQAGGALQVMSQGELHALTLALFLPRATLDESPFRFVVLDDPVQAMDPAKVDGLVALLTKIAKTRQVVVFSHDDRLPAALRRMNVSARIVEVVRGPGSAVSITRVEDPPTRYLNDADALCTDGNVPDETLRRTLPGLLRLAIEAAARDRFYAGRLSHGDALVDVESMWNKAHGTSQRVSLAVHGQIRSLDDWLRTESRRKGLGVATSAVHDNLRSGTKPKDAIYHARRMIDDIRGGAR
jgi:hypothetical protein